MASADVVRRLVARLPEVVEGPSEGRFAVRSKALCWPWQERVEGGRRRVPNPDARIFFTEPHYDGYPAILVRLAAIDEVLLAELLRDAWRIQAPRKLVRSLEGSQPSH